MRSETTSTYAQLAILRPFQEFFKLEASGGILLLVCTLAALVWANSSWADSYRNLWQTELTISLGGFGLAKPLLLWINDGLMAVFFFVVGLEIKREVLMGELGSLRRAALPIAAALGGVVLPALIFTAFNFGTESAAGWGIPVATDIAFALGVLALLGQRAPATLKVFLTALAIVDDIIAVLIIAVFYTAELSLSSLAVGLGVLLILILLNRLGVQNPLIYGLLGVVVWVAFLKSGIHATVAGVLVAMTIPARASINLDDFVQRSQSILDRLGNASEGAGASEETRQAAIHALEVNCEHVQAPLQRMEHALHSWVAFGIMPLFALANAGVAVSGDILAVLTQPVSLGIVFGLALGKSVGITAFSWLAVRSGLADKPAEMAWKQVYGAAWLAWIGFTMSLFISGLAFGDTPLLSTAKMGILAASALAAVIGWTLLRTFTPNGQTTEA